jgi:hypothetical protein
LGFFPLDSIFYAIVKYADMQPDPHDPPVVISKNVNSYIVTFKKYHLNTDIFQYYNTLNKQLASKQRIFDPIAIQVKGNITCISNPEEAVLGLFEASSVSLLTYIIDPNSFNQKIRLWKIPAMDMDKISATGQIKNKAPYFWVF